MPKVEVQWYGGHSWRRYPEASGSSDRNYFRRSISYGNPLYLHRVVWEDANGPVPARHHIHHRDTNPSNNALENLECLSPTEHKLRHPEQPELREWRLEHLARIRPSAAAWHGTPEGLAEHKRIGALSYVGFKPEPKPCAQCTTIFMPRKIGNQDLFCSNACKSASRRDSGVDDEDRICGGCDKVFRCSRYDRKRVCSRQCIKPEKQRNARAGL